MTALLGYATNNPATLTTVRTYFKNVPIVVPVGGRSVVTFKVTGRTWAETAAGLSDSVLALRAAEALAQRDHIHSIGFWHEADNGGLNSSFGTAADYVAAFRYVRAYFIGAGVNLPWNCILMGTSYSATSSGGWYPGNPYTDFVGVDCYDWSNSSSNGGFCTPAGGHKSFQNVSQGALDFANGKGKPLLVGETGTCARTDSSETYRASWVTAMGAYLKTQPTIEVLCYYNQDNSPTGTNWLLAGASQTAFRALAADPYFADHPSRLAAGIPLELAV